MIVHRDLRRVPCVRAVIDWTGQAFAERRDLIAGANQDDVSGIFTNEGSAYVFELVGSTYTQRQRLVFGGGTSLDGFGRSVAIDGDIAVVGAPNDDGTAGSNQGSAYIYERSGPGWIFKAKLTASV